MMQNKGIITIGLTGNSGCGKSTVSSYLKGRGAYVIDADRVAHELMKPESQCYNEIAAEFGTEILDSDRRIDRKKLANIVFSDKIKLNLLNRISHKHIVKEILKIREDIIFGSKEYKYVVIDAPLLFEAGLDKVCDTIWLVYADIEKRTERIIKRDNITREKAAERFKNQTPFEILKKKSDEILDNTNDDNSELLAKINELLQKL